jgi:phosphate transport system substrate-binding protein
MSYGLNKFSTRTKLLGAAVALVLAGSAQAVTLVGGGATLPSVGYVGANAATTTNLQFMGAGTGATNIDAGSLLGVIQTQSSNVVSYCLTGSGAGKNILAGVVGTSPNTNCTAAKLGFGGTTAGRTLTQASFAAADAPLAASDVSNYHTGRGVAAWPTQFPAIAGAVGIALNLKDTAGNQITNANFTTVQVCKIFSHTVTNWNDATLASAFPSPHVAPNQAINVEYRSDGSGTTFSFSNFLTNNCGSAGLANVFETSQTFGSTAGGPAGMALAGSVVTNDFPSGTTMPNGWVGSSGNTGVAMAVSSTANSIGYVEAANAQKLNASGMTSIQLAKVNNEDPLANFGTPLALPGAAIVYNEAIDTANNTNGTAKLAAIDGAPSTQCIALVAPANYAVVGSKGGVLKSGYPIVAISYLLGNAQSNPVGDLAATQFLVNGPYNSTVTNDVDPGLVGPGTGLAFLTLGTGAFGNTAPGDCLH